MPAHRLRLGISRTVLAVCAWFIAFGAAAIPPTASDMTRQQWHEHLRWDITECPVQRDDITASGVTVTALDAATALIAVECERWAYQGTYRFFLQTGETVVSLEFEQFAAPDIGRLDRYRSPLVTGTPLLTSPPRTLDILRKYRGAGDCGQFLRYRITDRAAILDQLRVRECGTLPSGRPVAPAYWPLRKGPG